MATLLIHQMSCTTALKKNVWRHTDYIHILYSLWWWQVYRHLFLHCQFTNKGHSLHRKEGSYKLWHCSPGVWATAQRGAPKLFCVFHAIKLSINTLCHYRPLFFCFFCAFWQHGLRVPSHQHLKQPHFGPKSKSFCCLRRPRKFAWCSSRVHKFSSGGTLTC